MFTKSASAEKTERMSHDFPVLYNVCQCHTILLTRKQKKYIIQVY